MRVHKWFAAMITVFTIAILLSIALYSVANPRRIDEDSRDSVTSDEISKAENLDIQRLPNFVQRNEAKPSLEQQRFQTKDNLRGDYEVDIREFKQKKSNFNISALKSQSKNGWLQNAVLRNRSLRVARSVSSTNFIVDEVNVNNLEKASVGNENLSTERYNDLDARKDSKKLEVLPDTDKSVPSPLDSSQENENLEFAKYCFEQFLSFQNNETSNEFLALYVSKKDDSFPENYLDDVGSGELGIRTGRVSNQPVDSASNRSGRLVNVMNFLSDFFGSGSSEREVKSKGEVMFQELDMSSDRVPEVTESSFVSNENRSARFVNVMDFFSDFFGSGSTGRKVDTNGDNIVLDGVKRTFREASEQCIELFNDILKNESHITKPNLFDMIASPRIREIKFDDSLSNSKNYGSFDESKLSIKYLSDHELQTLNADAYSASSNLSLSNNKFKTSSDKVEINLTASSETPRLFLGVTNGSKDVIFLPQEENSTMAQNGELNGSSEVSVESEIKNGTKDSKFFDITDSGNVSRTFFSSDDSSRTLFGSGDSSRTLFGSGDSSRTLFGSGDSSRTLFGSGDSSRTLFGSGDFRNGEDELKLMDSCITKGRFFMGNLFGSGDGMLRDEGNKEDEARFLTLFGSGDGRSQRSESSESDVCDIVQVTARNFFFNHFGIIDESNLQQRSFDELCEIDRKGRMFFKDRYGIEGSLEQNTCDLTSLEGRWFWSNFIDRSFGQGILSISGDQCDFIYIQERLFLDFFGSGRSAGNYKIQEDIIDQDHNTFNIFSTVIFRYYLETMSNDTCGVAEYLKSTFTAKDKAESSRNARLENDIFEECEVDCFQVDPQSSDYQTFNSDCFNESCSDYLSRSSQNIMNQENRSTINLTQYNLKSDYEFECETHDCYQEGQIPIPPKNIEQYNENTSHLSNSLSIENECDDCGELKPIFKDLTKNDTNVKCLEASCFDNPFEATVLIKTSTDGSKFLNRRRGSRMEDTDDDSLLNEVEDCDENCQDFGDASIHSTESPAEAIPSSCEHDNCSQEDIGTSMNESACLESCSEFQNNWPLPTTVPYQSTEGSSTEKMKATEVAKKNPIRFCTDSSLCSNYLNERCVTSNSGGSICDCGKGFIRHPTTRRCNGMLTLSVIFKFPDEQFDEALKIVSDRRFKEKKIEAEYAMWMLLRNSSNNAVTNLEVISFDPGSLIISWRLMFATSANETASTVINRLNSTLRKALQRQEKLVNTPLRFRRVSVLSIAIAINPCKNSNYNYCSRNAYCIRSDNRPTGFTCSCKEGYTDFSDHNEDFPGEICKADCIDNYCGDHGLCNTDNSGNLKCFCNGGYFGKKCQYSGVLIITCVSSVSVVITICTIWYVCYIRKMRNRRRYGGNRGIFGTQVRSRRPSIIVALHDPVVHPNYTATFHGLDTSTAKELVHMELPEIRVISASSGESMSSDSSFDYTSRSDSLPSQSKKNSVCLRT